MKKKTLHLVGIIGISIILFGCNSTNEKNLADDKASVTTEETEAVQDIVIEKTQPTEKNNNVIGIITVTDKNGDIVYQYEGNMEVIPRDDQYEVNVHLEGFPCECMEEEVCDE